MKLAQVLAICSALKYAPDTHITHI